MDFRKRKVTLVLLPGAILKFVIILNLYRSLEGLRTSCYLIWTNSCKKTKDKGLISVFRRKNGRNSKGIKKKIYTNLKFLKTLWCSMISTVTITLCQRWSPSCPTVLIFLMNFCQMTPTAAPQFIFRKPKLSVDSRTWKTSSAHMVKWWQDRPQGKWTAIASGEAGDLTK